jgi:hypothetical protein
MTAEIAAAQAQLREIVHDLEAVKLRLVGVKESLPEPDAGPEAAAADLETLDLRTEIRSVIECVLNDWMAPAIADLGEMAALPASPSEREGS